MSLGYTINEVPVGSLEISMKGQWVPKDIKVISGKLGAQGMSLEKHHLPGRDGETTLDRRGHTGHRDLTERESWCVADPGTPQGFQSGS